MYSTARFALLFPASLILLTLVCAQVSASTLFVPAGGDLQSAINNAQFGDTVVLQAGATFETTNGFLLPDKGAGTNFITITTSDPSTIPTALNNYPGSYTRITTSMSANMPKLVTTSTFGFPALYLAFKAHHYKLVGIEFTNKDMGVVVPRLIGSGFNGYETSVNDYAHDITFDQCFIHPVEETGDPGVNYHLRTVEKGIMFNGNVLIVSHTAIQGFTGWNRYSYAGAPAGTLRMDTNAILIGHGLGPVNIENSLLEGQANNLFIGGSGGFTPNSATATNITQTSATLSQVANLNVGDLIAVHDNNLTDPLSPSRWANAQITGISGNNVTYTHLTTKYKAVNDNSYLPVRDAELPAAGETVLWNGYILENVTIRRNIIPKPHVWYADLGSQKGLFEFKFVRRALIDGNVLPGEANGFVLTPRNQAGDTPWAEVSNITISNNWWYETGNQQVAMSLSDNEFQSVVSHDIIVSNNLATYPGGQDGFTGYAFSQIGKGSNVSFIHNTLLIPSHFLFGANTTANLQLRDNIIRSAYYLVPCSLGSTVTACWPNAMVHHNLLLNDAGIDVTNWTSAWPDHTWVQNTIGGVGFTNPGSKLDGTGNYRLLSGSPYHGAASDGKDLGVDFDQLNAAIFGNGPVPTPTPTPVPTVTPIPTTTPTPTPTPTPFIPPPVTTGATASFVQLDSTTQGNWQNNYGTDGYNVIGNSAAYPSYVQVNPISASSYMWAPSTTAAQALQKAGATDRIAGCWYQNGSFSVDLNVTDGQAHRVALYALDWDNLPRTERFDIVDVNTNALLDSRTISSFSQGQYLVWDVKGHIKINVSQIGYGNAVVSGLFFGGGVAPSNSAGAVASFVQLDTTTKGNWQNLYGTDGYNVIGNSVAYPSYVQVNPISAASYTWASSTTAAQALQKAGASDRVAACWYQSGAYSVDVNVTDGQAHRMALYALDWDSLPRTQRFDIVDANTNALLDSRAITGFSQGQYLVWDIKGHIKINITQIGYGNAVLSGLFFGGVASGGSTAAAASFVQLDTSTKGNWQNLYGTAGYNVIGNSAAYPSYVQVNPISASTYTWASSTTAAQALQKIGASDRIAACWYQGGVFSVDVNVTDGQTHRMALYALDWDSLPRTQRFDIVDANTNALLDTRAITGFSQGQYLVWDIKGHIKINITQIGYGNSVVSGLFFGP